MIHLSSYHSNGQPTVVWSNKVNLIGEKVYKPKIHFCEQCNKPILIYGRLIPCKHVFCFSCAALCLTQQTQQQQPNRSNSPPPPPSNNHRHHQVSSPHEPPPLPPPNNYSQSPLAQNQHDSPLNSHTSSASIGKGCHRCGGKALRVERNTLNSIFVCQVENCRRTYLSARDLQAHVNHRHSENKSTHHTGTSSASLAAISSSPYISSSTQMHLNSNQSSSHHHQRQSTSSTCHSNNQSNNSPSYHNQHNRHDRDGQHGRHRDRDRYRYRDSYQRDRERERDSKEYHRQSIQRAAQWAEASAQIMEKGLTR